MRLLSLTFLALLSPGLLAEPAFATRVQGILADPTVLFLLFVLATTCLYIELAHPGAIVPGVIGALALILFLFSAGSIQPNWAGLALMLLAIVLLAIDVRAPTHGFLTVSALVSLVIGALIFFDTGSNPEGQGLNPWALVGAVAAPRRHLHHDSELCDTRAAATRHHRRRGADRQDRDGDRRACAHWSCAAARRELGRAACRQSRRQ